MSTSHYEAAQFPWGSPAMYGKSGNIFKRGYQISYSVMVSRSILGRQRAKNILWVSSEVPFWTFYRYRPVPRIIHLFCVIQAIISIIKPGQSFAERIVISLFVFFPKRNRWIPPSWSVHPWSIGPECALKSWNSFFCRVIMAPVGNNMGS